MRLSGKKWVAFAVATKLGDSVILFNLDIIMSTEDDCNSLVNLFSGKLDGEASKYLQKAAIKELKFVNGA